MRKKGLYLMGAYIFVLLFSACQPAEVEPQFETIVETVVVERSGEPVEVIVTATPLPDPTDIPVGPRTLVICQGGDPVSLYSLNNESGISKDNVLSALYDGPIDNRDYDYQAVILEKLPSLADGDASLEPVAVNPGDRFVDAYSNPTALEAGVLYRPAGCQSLDCASTYEEGVGGVTVDQMVVRFRILPGIVWSDGEPVKASDSVYAYQLSLDPDTPGGQKFLTTRTESYEALDHQTTVWKGVPGYLDNSYFLNFIDPLPEHIYANFTALELTQADLSNRTPLGWGPYKIDAWDEGEDILLSRNENYFRYGEGLPSFELLVYRNVGLNPDANLARLLSGECDVVLEGGMNSQIELLYELDIRGEIQTQSTVGTFAGYAQFGIQHISYDDGWQQGDRPDFFSDVRTRRAIALCMDRDNAVSSTAYAGGNQVLHSYVPPQHPLYNANVARYDFNVAAGQQLLEEAGWMVGEDGVRIYTGDNENIPAGTRLSFDVVSPGGGAGALTDAIPILLESLPLCGIEYDLIWIGNAELFGDGPEGVMFGRNFDLGFIGWLTGVDPPCDLWIGEAIPGEGDAFPYGWGGWNATGWADPGFDRVCNAALSTLRGQPGYAENHLLAQEIFADQLPVVPLFLATKFATARADFCGKLVNATTNDNLQLIEELNYGPGCGGG